MIHQAEDERQESLALCKQGRSKPVAWTNAHSERILTEMFSVFAVLLFSRGLKCLLYYLQYPLT